MASMEYVIFELLRNGKNDSFLENVNPVRQLYHDYAPATAFHSSGAVAVPFTYFRIRS
jgi:hypothetical protein